MLLGGIPRERTVLVEGEPGTGKTILSLHFLLAGILFPSGDPEPGVLVCLDSKPADVIREAASFGWDLNKLMDLNQFIMIDAFSGRLGLKPELPFAIPVGKFEFKTIMDRISEAQEKVGAKRLVIDPVSALLDDLDIQERREAVMRLAALLSRLSLTTLLTSELDEVGTGVERYASHGIIKLLYEKVEGSVKRRLRIVKMRGTMHSMDIIPFDISSKGIELKV